MRGAVAQLGLVQHHPGEERAQRKGDVKQLDGAKGNAQRQRRTESVNSSREPVAALRDMIHGTRRRPTSIMMAINATTLPMVMLISSASEAKPIFSFHHPGDGGQQNQRQHHYQIFNNQPAYRDLPALAVYQLPLFKRAQHTTVLAVERHSPNTIPVMIDQPSTAESAMPSSVATYLGDRSRYGDRLYRHQILQGKMQPDAKHQQDHA